MPSMRQLTSVLAVLAALARLGPRRARARVVVASGDGAATLTDVTTNKVVARIPVGARSRAAAVAPDGTRGYVAAGRRVVAIDLATRAIAAGVNAGGGVTALAASRRRPAPVRGAARGDRRHRRPDDDASGRRSRSAREATRRRTGDLLRRDAAVVVLDSKHVGVVDLVRFRLSRRVTLAGADRRGLRARRAQRLRRDDVGATARASSASTPRPGDVTRKIAPGQGPGRRRRAHQRRAPRDRRRGAAERR